MPLDPRHLRECFQLRLIEQALEQQRDPGAFAGSGAVAGIEVEHDLGGAIDVRRAMEEWVQFEVGEVCRPHQRRQVVNLIGM